jgi:hypothetical protein
VRFNAPLATEKTINSIMADLVNNSVMQVSIKLFGKQPGIKPQPLIGTLPTKHTGSRATQIELHDRWR